MENTEKKSRSWKMVAIVKGLVFERKMSKFLNSMQSKRFLLDGYDSQTTNFDYRKWATHTQTCYTSCLKMEMLMLSVHFCQRRAELSSSRICLLGRGVETPPNSTLTVDKTKITTKVVENSVHNHFR